MPTTIIKAKCMHCGLHFSAFSWSPDWKPAFCPECGKGAAFMVWRESTDRQVYEFVPGRSELVSLSMPRAADETG